jgi:flavin-dependent dehydrogenase
MYMYDAIVIGARCAGSPTAMLLAQKGYRVLLVDKATFPSDTMSTHYIHPRGVAHLKRWGVLEQVIDSNCPPVAQATFDLGPFALVASTLPVDGVAAGYGPRRTVLDTILVDAAVKAGAELREGFSMQELIMDGERVTGIRGRSASGMPVTEEAHLIIGADGMRSLVARSVQAPEYHRVPSLSCGYYSYWSGIDIEGVEFYPREGCTMLAFPTNDDLVCVACVWPQQMFPTIRADIEGNFNKTLDLAPALAQRVRLGKREERFVGTADVPNFFRKPYGPGWALVGDAGYHKDPILAHGITDAFRDAELLAAAVHAGLSGQRPLEEALAEYERQRNEAAFPIYELSTQFARLEPPSPEMQQLFAAMRGNQAATECYFATIEGTISPAEFFSPENIGQIMEQAA